MPAVVASGLQKIMADSSTTNIKSITILIYDVGTHIAGLKMINKKPYILKLEKSEVETKYKELGTIKDVAKYFNSSPSTMERFFRRAGILYVKKHKNNFDEQFFSQDDPQSFYLAGFIAADGNIRKDKYTLKIELAEEDMQFLQTLKDLLSFQGDLHKSMTKNSKRNSLWQDTTNYYFQCSSKHLVQDLKRFNIVPNKTKIYDFPNWLIDHSLVNHFMRGYFDGDGHIGLRNQNKLRWHLAGNFSFLEKFQSILEKEIGIHHNNIFTRPNGLSCLEYTGNIIVPKICQFLYNNSAFHLDRKYNIYKDWLNT
jgi:intein-encoded DNA endonuclease-like protein